MRYRPLNNSSHSAIQGGGSSDAGSVLNTPASDKVHATLAVGFVAAFTPPIARKTVSPTAAAASCAAAAAGAAAACMRSATAGPPLSDAALWAGLTNSGADSNSGSNRGRVTSPPNCRPIKTFPELRAECVVLSSVFFWATCVCIHSALLW